MHQLITDHVLRPGVTQQAKLWTALRDLITEFEDGAHRETFSKWDLYRSIIAILTDQLDLFEIAWECVEVITPLAGMGLFDQNAHSPRCSNQPEAAIRTGNWARPLSIGCAEEWPSLVQTTRITAAIGSER